MGYFDWHEQPGYWRDFTRHFDPDVNLLDVGCGTGWLADHFQHYRGIDGSPDAVAEAVRRGRNVTQGDLAEGLPYEDESFDAAMVKDVLEHILEPADLVREVRRVLKPGGRVYASSPDAQRWVWDDYTHVRPFTMRGFRRLFSDNGFEIERWTYESVMPGIGYVSRYTRRKRRPRTLNALAWLRLVRRNVVVVARRSG